MTAAQPITAVPIQDEVAIQRSFTSSKLDWMTALNADPRLSAQDFKVGFCIAQHVGRTSGVAMISDETISDKTNVCRRSVARSRANLKAYGWLDWKRTMTANIYWTLATSLNAVTDHQVLLKDKREESRAKRRAGRRDMSKVAHLRASDVTPLAYADMSKVADTKLPEVANIHLSRNTLVGTPSKNHPSGCARLDIGPFDLSSRLARSPRFSVRGGAA